MNRRDALFCLLRELGAGLWVCIKKLPILLLILLVFLFSFVAVGLLGMLGTYAVFPFDFPEITPLILIDGFYVGAWTFTFGACLSALLIIVWTIVSTPICYLIRGYRKYRNSEDGSATTY